MENRQLEVSEISRQLKAIALELKIPVLACAQLSRAPAARTDKRPMLLSLIHILCSVALWFMGYNAVTTAFTKYVSVQWGYDIKAASQCLMVATVGAQRSEERRVGKEC